MLAEFQSLYPQGSIISELVQIYHGKYIVRASVQIEGVIRATGMAAAETPEEAEDRARSRALMVLGITSTPEESQRFSPAQETELVKPSPSLAPISGLNESAYSATLNSFPQIEATLPLTSKNDAKSQDLSEEPLTSKQETEFDGMMFDNKAENNQLPGISASNVTPFPSRSYSLQEDMGTENAIGKRKKKSEPVDHSDAIAKIDVEMERLGWTKDQGRDYLIKTYGKRARSLLNDEELLGFLKYLESQPTPPDPLAGF